MLAFLTLRVEGQKGELEGRGSEGSNGGQGRNVCSGPRPSLDLSQPQRVPMQSSQLMGSCWDSMATTAETVSTPRLGLTSGPLLFQIPQQDRPIQSRAMAGGCPGARGPVSEGRRGISFVTCRDLAISQIPPGLQGLCVLFTGHAQAIQTRVPRPCWLRPLTGCTMSGFAASRERRYVQKTQTVSCRVPMLGGSALRRPRLGGDMQSR